MTATTDERAGLPFASGMDRLAHCPSSFEAEAGLTELATEEVARSGTAIHGALETGDDSELTLTEAEIAERLKRMEETETANFMMAYNIEDAPRIIREERFWIRNPETLEPIGSAKPDYIALFPAKGSVPPYAAVFNFKTGFKSPTPSELSWQSRTEVLSLWQSISPGGEEFTTIRGGFLSHRLSSKVDTTDYTQADLQRVYNELRVILWRSQQKDAPRVPGTWCRYCRARGTCREYAVYGLIVSARVQLPAGKKPDQLALIEAVGRMTPQEMAFVFRRKSAVETVYEAIEARLKQLPQDELVGLGYTVKPGNANKEIVHVATAFQRLGAILTDEERIQCIKIVRGPAAKLLAAKAKLSEKTAALRVLEVMGDAVREKPGNPRLVEL